MLLATLYWTDDFYKNWFVFHKLLRTFFV
jgi:hypothetical protein